MLSLTTTNRQARMKLTESYNKYTRVFTPKTFSRNGQNVLEVFKNEKKNSTLHFAHAQNIYNC